MRLSRSIPSTLGMIGGFANIIWLGVVVLMLLIYLDFTGGRSDLGLISILFFTFFSTIALRSSARFDAKKNSFKLTAFSTLLLILNSIIFSFLVSRSIHEFLLFFMILLGPGIIFLIPASYLQLKEAKSSRNIKFQMN